jgi:hypothetical protein
MRWYRIKTYRGCILKKGQGAFFSDPSKSFEQFYIEAESTEDAISRLREFGHNDDIESIVTADSTIIPNSLEYAVK